MSKKKKTVSLYALLKVDKAATAAQIKKAYYALARKTHPDKRPGDAEAARNFQALKKAYDVLSDAKRRERYDVTGSTSEDDAFAAAYEFYKGVKITEDDIDKFHRNYKNSAEELADVLAYIRAHSGDISRILESVIGSTDADVDRYKRAARKAFQTGELRPEFRPAFDESSTRLLSLAELEAEGIDLEGGNDDVEEEEEDLDDDEDEEDDGESMEDEAKIDLDDRDGPSPKKRHHASIDEPSSDLLAAFAARRSQREEGFAKFEEKWARHAASEQDNLRPSKAPGKGGRASAAKSSKAQRAS